MTDGCSTEGRLETRRTALSKRRSSVLNMLARSKLIEVTPSDEKAVHLFKLSFHAAVNSRSGIEAATSTQRPQTGAPAPSREWIRAYLPLSKSEIETSGIARANGEKRLFLKTDRDYQTETVSRTYGRGSHGAIGGGV